MKKTVHMIGNAHLDPVWLWDWREGHQENQATLLSALNRLDEFDDFVFTCSSAQFYAWIEDSNPELFAKIQKYVEAGRWVIVGGWWVQPDCNIPHGESFARHALISQNYFQEKFGRIAKTGYCVDSFGHNAMIPQLLRRAGMENYVFQRPSVRENPDLPEAAFLWQAPDGSTVRTYRLLEGYCIWEHIEEVLSTYPERGPKDQDNLMLFYGVGNHGGGPTIRNIELIRRLQKMMENMKVVFSDPDTYFKTLDVKQLPLVKGELQHHAPGCYAAESMVKNMNRRAENALLSAEKLCVMAELAGKPVANSDMTEAWQQVLFNQFHDTLAGTGKESAYYDARNQLGEAVSVANRNESRALRAIGYDIDIPLDEDTLPMVVYNPHSWAVKTPVEFETGMFGNIPFQREAYLTDSEGNVVPFQYIDSSCKVWNRTRYTFVAEVPAMGYAVYFLHRGDKEPAVRQDDAIALENEYLRVAFDPETGAVSSILDKRTGKQVLSAPASAVVLQDDTDTWGHTLVRLDEPVGAFKLERFKVMDKGDVRECVKVISRYGESTLTQVYSLYAGEAQIRVEATVNWQARNKALKLMYPVNTQNGTPTCEIPFGHIEKAMDGREEAMQQWADLSGSGVGLSILNNNKYSVNFHDDTIGFTVLRSPVYAHHDPYVLREDEEYSYIDQGIQRFSYVLMPHDGCWRKAGVMREAALLNQPLITAFETFHPGRLPLKKGFLTVEQENVQLTALKKAYRGEGTILRLFESFGAETETEIELNGTAFTAKFAPYEIKTFRVQPDGKVQEVNFMEWPVG